MMRALYLCEAAAIAEQAPEGATPKQIAEMIRAAARHPAPRPSLGPPDRWHTTMSDIMDEYS